MTGIGQLTTKKSIELAMKDIKEWRSKLNVNGLDIDHRYDVKTNVAVLRFKFKGKDYEFILRKQRKAQIMGIEDLGDSMFRYQLEGKVEPPAATTPANEMNYVKLGISPLASNQELQEKYRVLMKSFHPDRVNSKEAKTEFEKRAADINQAYNEIKKERGIK